MDVILAASDKTKLKEVIGRMKTGEKSLHSKTIGPVKVFRLNTLPVLLETQLKDDLKAKRLTAVKKAGGILICERKTL